MLGSISLALIDEAGHVIIEEQEVHDRDLRESLP
jgi:hypothetical protein